MEPILEVPRPYSEVAFALLPSERAFVLRFKNTEHKFWAASSRIERIVSQMTSLNDAIWLCNTLNDVEISNTFKASSRGMTIRDLETLIQRLEEDQKVIQSNPEMAQLMDDPHEIERNIVAAQHKLKELKKITIF